MMTIMFNCYVSEILRKKEKNMHQSCSIPLPFFFSYNTVHTPYIVYWTEYSVHCTGALVPNET